MEMAPRFKIEVFIIDNSINEPYNITKFSNRLRSVLCPYMNISAKNVTASSSNLCRQVINNLFIVLNAIADKLKSVSVASLQPAFHRVTGANPLGRKAFPEQDRIEAVCFFYLTL
jgi:hypothetical protein